MLRLPRLIGHRGVAAYAPENTLAGINAAADMGVLMVEVDVTLTKDGVPVLLHDEHVDRTTNGTGAIAEMTYEEITSLDAGRWFGNAFIGQRIPTLVDALDLMIKRDLLLNLEIKPTSGMGEETASIALTTALAIWPEGRQPPLVSSFDAEALDAARKFAPDWPRGYLIDHRPVDWRDQAERFAATTINVNGRRETAETIAAYRDAGWPVLAYTVNAIPMAQELLRWGVRSLFTDDPLAIAPALKSA